LEKKIPAETRAKLPILDKLLPLTNYIACGLAVVLVVVLLMVAFSKKINSLVGQWEYWTGDVVWFFGKSSVIVFMSDGTVIRRDNGNSGNWISSSGEQLTVIEDDDVFYFNYKVQDNMLTIIYSDGDKIVYERRTGREASGTATSFQSSRTPTMLSGTFSTILRLGSSSERLYYTFNTNGTYVYGTGYAGAVRTGTYTVSGDTVTLSGGETFTIVNSNTLSAGNSLWTK